MGNTATIHTLPIWKKGATPAEWLQELAACALTHPEQWAKAVIVFQETNERGFSQATRYYAYGNVSNTDVLGILEEGKLHVYDYMRGRV